MKGGSNDYDAVGGNVAGSWLSPSHTLITAELPSHRHSYTRYPSANLWVYKYVGNIWYPYDFSTVNTGSTGGGGGHRHGTNTYRPYSVVGIIAKYDGE